METIWHMAPFLRLTLPLILGAFGGYFLPIDHVLIIILLCGVILGLGVIFLFLKKWKYIRNQIAFGAILTVTFILAGAGLSLQQRYNNLPSLDLPTYGNAFFAKVIAFPQKKENSVKLELEINAVSTDSILAKPSEAKLLAYAPHEMKLDTLIPGDMLFFESKPQAYKKPVNPGQFDYGAYLMKNGIAGTVYFHQQVKAKRPTNSNWSLISLFAKIQNYCVKTFENSGLAPRELGVASALILGERSLILPDTKAAFATAGAVHILAVSGLHVGIIYLFVIGLFKRILPMSRWRVVNLTLTILLLWIYAGITGFSPSVLRAATMFSFIAIGKHGGRGNNVYNMLAASAFVLVVFNSQIISEVGFQLSYLAVLGISVLYKPIYNFFIFDNWLSDKIWSLMVVSFAAQIATFPLSIYYFSQFPNLFLITNLVVIPAATLALYTGLIFIILHLVPYIGDFVALVLNWTLICLNNFIDWISTFSFALSDNLHFSIGVVVLVYILIYSFVKFYNDPRKWNLWRPILILAILTTLWTNRKITIAKAVEITVLEGSNESLLVLQKGRNGIIFTNDTSETQKAKNKYLLSGYCNKVGIDKLDWKPYNSEFVNKKFYAKGGNILFNGILVHYPLAEDRNQNVTNFKPTITIISNEYVKNNLELPSRNTIYILDSTISPHRRKQIITTLLENKTRFWDLHYQGAFFADKHVRN